MQFHGQARRPQGMLGLDRFARSPLKTSGDGMGGMTRTEKRPRLVHSTMSLLLLTGSNVLLLAMWDTLAFGQKLCGWSRFLIEFFFKIPEHFPSPLTWWGHCQTSPHHQQHWLCFSLLLVNPSVGQLIGGRAGPRNKVSPTPHGGLEILRLEELPHAHHQDQEQAIQLWQY